MNFHVQILSEDIFMALQGNEGMLTAADRYCDARETLELSEYVDWLGSHDLRARLWMRPDIKGFFYRRQVKKAVQSMNERLQRLGALIPENEITQEEVEQTLLRSVEL